MAVERMVDSRADEAALLRARPPAAKAYPTPSQSERRVDPEDGVAYSFSEFAKLNRDYFEEHEIIEYWFDSMRIDLPEGAKLFVENLSAQITDAELRTAFAPFGEILQCEVFRDSETKAPKGFATVHFASAQAAGRALAEMNGAELRRQRLAVRLLSGRQEGAAVFLGALPEGATAREVEAVLSRCGRVARCELLEADGRPRLKGQARVDFVFPESAREAVWELHMKDGAFRGSKVVVHEWKEDDNGKRVPGPSVFVAKLDPRTSHEEVWELFEGVGAVVVDVLLFRNKDSAGSTTIGKVELGDAESCRLASERLHGSELHGAGIIVRQFGLQPQGSLQAARAPAQSAGPERGTGAVATPSGATSPATTRERHAGDHAVFVSGLGPETTDAKLQAHFACIGALPTFCKIFRHDNGISRGSGKVVFETQEEQERAIEELQCTILDGRSLRLRVFVASQSDWESRCAAQAAATTGWQAFDEAALADESRGRAEPGHAVFVSRLNAETSAEALRNHCLSCGAVYHVRLLLDRDTRQPRGLAKVVFASELSARAALEELDESELDGCRIRVREHRGPRGTVDEVSADADGKSIYQENIVFVGGLDFRTSLEALKAHLQHCGEIAAGELLVDKYSGKPKGHARIAFSDKESAQRAIAEMDGQELDGRTLLVRPWQTTSGSLIHDANAVFVSGLFFDTTSERLKEHCGCCGKVVYASAGRHIGFGKVIFADYTSKMRALNELSGTWLDGRAISVQDYSAAKDRTGSGKYVTDEPSTGSSNVVFVSGLGVETTSEDLREHLEICGRVLYANLLFDKSSGQPLGSARVAFGTATAKARAFKELDGAKLCGHALSLRDYTPNDEGVGVLRWRGDHEQCCVLVTGLGFGTTIDQLVEHFRACGQIVNAQLHVDKDTGRPKGSARITFATREGKSTAIGEHHGSELDGYVISVRDDTGPEFGIRGKGKGGKGNGKSRFSIYVSGLGPWTDETRLAEHFAACGEIEECLIFIDRATGQSKCSGKVIFASESAMKRALETWDGAPLDGFTTRVREFGKPPRGGPAVFVSGLHPSTDDEALRRHFEEAGMIAHAFVVKDSSSMASSCLGKVAFVSEAGKERALREWNGSTLDGRFITVRDCFSIGKGGGWPHGGNRDASFGDELEGGGFRHEAGHRSSGSDAAPSGEEGAKVDPDDGETYTFAEFMAKHRGSYSDRELKEYWASECKAVPANGHGEGTRPAAASMTIAEWLTSVHSSLLVYREAIEESYASLGQILSLHASTGSGGARQLEAGFFERAGITRIAHKRLINKWVNEST